MVVDQHDEARRSERVREGLEAVLHDPGKAMRHCDGRVRSTALRRKQPGSEFDTFVGGDPYAELREHGHPPRRQEL
jgi:hypothetical protein